MATAAQIKAAKAYARDAGYKEGERYSPFDLGSSFSAHRGHGLSVYTGINNGTLEFRCDGCSEAIWVRPPADQT